MATKTKTFSGGGKGTGAQKVLNELLDEFGKGLKLDTSNPFGFDTDQEQIRKDMDAATQAEYALQALQANRALNNAEVSAQGNIQNTIADLNKTLAGSASSAGNKGVAAATALQSLLGLNQQNNTMVTDALNGILDVGAQRTNAMLENVNAARQQADSARQMQGSLATDKYASDAAKLSEMGAALSTLGSAYDNTAAQMKMNDATNASQEKIAKTTQKQKVTYGGTYTVKNK